MVGITVVGQAAKKALLDTLRRAAEVLECHHVAGEDSYLMSGRDRPCRRWSASSSSINGYGETRTSIVFSTPIPRRGLVRPGSVRRVVGFGTIAGTMSPPAAPRANTGGRSPKVRQ